MEHRIRAGDIAKGRSDLLQTLLQMEILKSTMEEILDTPVEEFEKGIEAFLEQENDSPASAPPSAVTRSGPRGSRSTS